MNICEVGNVNIDNIIDEIEKCGEYKYFYVIKQDYDYGRIHSEIDNIGRTLDGEYTVRSADLYGGYDNKWIQILVQKKHRY